jgi:phospholipid-binding lipoprotein MlaA
MPRFSALRGGRMRSTIGRLCVALGTGLALLVPPAAAADGAPAPDPLFDDEFPDGYQTELGASVPDPLEGANRAFFSFNDHLDQLVFVPLTSVYQLVIPKPARLAIRRAFRNLRSPVYFVNNLLQLRFHDAAETLGGFALNTTVGWLGFFDPATHVGWESHPTDFGFTLGFYGVGSGPYLVLPLFGPSTLRDGIGDIVDRGFDPLTYLLGFGELVVIGGGSGFVTREAKSDALAALRDSSVDYYAAMRSAYTQNRESEIAALRARMGWGARGPQKTAVAD